MKKLLLLTACVFCMAIVNAQTDTALQFNGIIITDSNESAEKLYQRAESWFGKTFKNSKLVLDVNDKPAGVLEGKGNFEFSLAIPMGAPGNGYISFNVSLRTKDGRCKYAFDSFKHTCLGPYPSWGTITTAPESPPVKWGVGQSLKNKQWNSMQESVNTVVSELISSLTRTLQKDADNW